MFNVYIIRSEVTKKHYIGHTKDLADRLRRHNNSQNKSTKNGVPWEIVYTEEFSTRSEAIKRELEIKKRGAERFISNNKK
jgi:putative endonuclease